MLNATDKVIAALLAAGLSLAAVEARADLFDFLRPKRPAAVARAQAPDGRTFGAGAYSSGNPWQPQPTGSNQADNYANYDFGGGGPTVNCGECDRGQGKVSFCRKLWHQTYYPRSAPYCQPDWGWNQTCWRRMKDNYNCPRPDWHGSCPEPPAPLLPQTPVVPPTTTYLPPPRSQVNRPVSYAGQRQPVSGRAPHILTLDGQTATGQQQPASGHAPLGERGNNAVVPNARTDAGGWDYEEEASPQPVTAPPRGQGHSNYYLGRGVSR